MTGRTIEYAFPPRPARRPTSAGCCGSTGWRRAGEFADVVVHRPRRRDRRPRRVWSAPGARRSSRRSTARARRTPGTVRVDGRRCAPARSPAAVRGRARAGARRSARARRCCSASRWRATSRCRRCRGSRRAGLARPRTRSCRAASAITAQLDVRPADPTRPVRTLSGGNQQKVVLARWLLGAAGAAARRADPRRRRRRPREIYALIRRLADEGVGVLLVSSEVPEVLGLADRVLVMREGRVVHEAPAPSSTSPACSTWSWRARGVESEPSDVVDREPRRRRRAGAGPRRRRAGRVEQPAGTPAAAVGVARLLDSGAAAATSGSSPSCVLLVRRRHRHRATPS